MAWGNEDALCRGVVTDAIFGPAGLLMDATFAFRFNEAGEIAHLGVMEPYDYRASYAYERDVLSWIRRQHPSHIEAVSDHGRFTRDPPGVQLLTTLVPEFIAQSPDWPIEEVPVDI